MSPFYCLHLTNDQRLSPRAARALADVPRLERGREYLLMTTAPSTIGLSTTVGLGQGCFFIRSVGKEEMAVNAFNNSGLFDGMEEPEGYTGGPIAYGQLVDQIRALLGQ